MKGRFAMRNSRFVTPMIALLVLVLVGAPDVIAEPGPIPGLQLAQASTGPNADTRAVGGGAPSKVFQQKPGANDCGGVAGCCMCWTELTCEVVNCPPNAPSGAVCRHCRETQICQSIPCTGLTRPGSGTVVQ